MRQVPILMYHWFRPATSPSTSRSPQLEISPELFERQLRLLEDKGYRTVTLEQAFAVGGRAALPPRPIVLTFDDGTLDFWEHARPALERHEFTATLFIVTGHVGGESSWDRGLGEPARRLMSWEQISELCRAGFEIGSHTRSHRPMTELTDDEARCELAESRRTLDERLGVAPRFLAYPRGFFATRHRRIAQEAGYRGACAVILRWGDLFRSERYELRRMTVKGTESMLRFRLRLGLCRLVRYAG